MRIASALFHTTASHGGIPDTKALLRSRNGASVWLYVDDFIDGSIKFRNETSSDNSFDVGAVIISSFTFSLNNFDGRWNSHSFVGDQIDGYSGYIFDVSTDLEQEDGDKILAQNGAVIETEGDVPQEHVQMGHYYLVSHKTVGNIINCEAYDALKLLDESKCTMSFSDYITCYGAVAQIANRHGIVMASGSFPNGDTRITSWPDEEMTDRQALAYIVQMCGCYARINSDGKLEVAWYDSDSAHDIETLFSHDLYTNDVNITGVRVVYGEDKDEYLVGSEGYVIEIADNPLIDSFNYDIVAQNIAYNLVGMTFCPGSFSCLSNPAYEVGDVFRVTDAKGNSRTVISTSVTFTPTLQERIRCGAESEEQATDLRPTELSIRVDRLKKATDVKVTAFDAALSTLSTLMGSSMGLYPTEQVQEDGSIIFIWHNKPNLSESDKIWKATGDAFAVSNDGGQTWTAGVDADGNMLVNILSAIGINADWLQVGIIHDAEWKNYWNLTTGEISITPSSSEGSVTVEMLEAAKTYLKQYADSVGQSTKTDVENDISDSYYSKSQTDEIINNRITLNKQQLDIEYYDAFASKDDTLASVTVYYAQSNSNVTAPLTGWSTKAPTWVSGRYVWQKTVSIDAAGNTTESEATCLTGANGQTGAPGQDGKDGKDGKDGINGKDGKDGINGTNGKDGANGKDGKDGVNGKDGKNGTDGKGIANVEQYYALSQSSTTAPTAWSTTIPTIDATNKYLWNYSVYKYTDNTSSSTNPHVVGAYGDDGTSGLNLYIISDNGTETSKDQPLTSKLTGIVNDGSGEDVDPLGTLFTYAWYKRADSGGIELIGTGKRTTININASFCDDKAAVWFEIGTGDELFGINVENGDYLTTESGENVWLEY